MKKISFLLISIICYQAFGQSVTLLPNSLSSEKANFNHIESINETALTLKRATSGLYTGLVFKNYQEALTGNLAFGTSGAIIWANNSNSLIFKVGSVAVDATMGVTPTGMVSYGFTKLGSDAPAIKLKKLTTGCTTSANSGFPSGEISLTHGITPSKILKVEALVEYTTNFWVKDGNDLFGYEFDVYVTNTTISLRNLSGSASSEIRSKPCKVLITYEE